MRRLLLTVIAAAFALGVSPTLGDPAPGTPIDIGPAIGAHIPEINAVDANGAPRAFASLPGAKGVVLVFFRSAKWCPFCQRQLLDLKAAQKPLADRGYGLAAMSYDPPEVLDLFAKKQGLTYLLLSDPGSVTIDAFRLRDPQYPPTSFAYGVPKPAIFVINRRGVVRAKLALEGFKVRPDTEAMLKAVDAIS